MKKVKWSRDSNSLVIESRSFCIRTDNKARHSNRTGIEGRYTEQQGKKSADVGGLDLSRVEERQGVDSVGGDTY